MPLDESRFAKICPMKKIIFYVNVTLNGAFVTSQLTAASVVYYRHLFLPYITAIFTA